MGVWGAWLAALHSLMWLFFFFFFSTRLLVSLYSLVAGSYLMVASCQWCNLVWFRQSMVLQMRHEEFCVWECSKYQGNSIKNQNRKSFHHLLSPPPKKKKKKNKKKLHYRMVNI